MANVLLNGRVVTYGSMEEELRRQHGAERSQEMLDDGRAPEFDEARDLDIEFAAQIAGWMRGRGLDVEIRR